MECTINFYLYNTYIYILKFLEKLGNITLFTLNANSRDYFLEH